MWKSLNVIDYPTQWIKRKDVLKRASLKNSNKPDLVISGKSHTQSSTFLNAPAKLWNDAPPNIKACKTLTTAKKCIKVYIQNLPI